MIVTKLKILRKKSKKKLREVAEKVGVTPQTVRQQENYGIYKITTARRYAMAFDNCNPLDLLDD